MLTRIILWISAISFGVYGLICFFDPELPARVMNNPIVSGDALLDAAAMFGGVQIAIGIFCVMGLRRSEYQRPALLLIALVTAGLAIGRLTYWPQTDLSVTWYTQVALVFEVAMAIAATVALRQ